ncbi:hypothetical protein B0H17DRAFT_1145972 [Mycena rosella]|uniref:Secreted protein n=1 Tax=Mycena rosella TaxID=1033263 RepID=A0AAD7CS87_MYCRO|nr:hypothetical protein B0H17DRAFT_1145972 [Mycena rosella]
MPGSSHTLLKGGWVLLTTYGVWAGVPACMWNVGGSSRMHVECGQELPHACGMWAGAPACMWNVGRSSRMGYIAQGGSSQSPEAGAPVLFRPAREQQTPPREQQTVPAEPENREKIPPCRELPTDALLTA